MRTRIREGEAPAAEPGYSNSAQGRRFRRNAPMITGSTDRTSGSRPVPASAQPPCHHAAGQRPRQPGGWLRDVLRRELRNLCPAQARLADISVLGRARKPFDPEALGGVEELVEVLDREL